MLVLSSPPLPFLLAGSSFRIDISPDLGSVPVLGQPNLQVSTSDNRIDLELENHRAGSAFIVSYPLKPVLLLHLLISAAAYAKTGCR